MEKLYKKISGKLATEDLSKACVKSHFLHNTLRVHAHLIKITLLKVTSIKLCFTKLLGFNFGKLILVSVAKKKFYF